MKANVLIVLVFMLFVGPVFAAVNQCVKLNPDTVCTAVTGAKYNVSDSVVNCGGQQVNLVGICVSNSGTADQTVRDNISVSTTQTSNMHCWCMMFKPVPSRWVYRYKYSNAYDCKMQCAVGCNNAFIYDGSGDKSFRRAMMSNLIQ
jgi:hypothetical protein